MSALAPGESSAVQTLGRVLMVRRDGLFIDEQFVGLLFYLKSILWADTGKPLGVLLDVSLAWETTKKALVTDKRGFAGPHSDKFTVWLISSFPGP